MTDKATMQWVAEQGEYITRLASLPWTGDEANVANVRGELLAMLRALGGDTAVTLTMSVDEYHRLQHILHRDSVRTSEQMDAFRNKWGEDSVILPHMRQETTDLKHKFHEQAKQQGLFGPRSTR